MSKNTGDNARRRMLTMLLLLPLGFSALLLYDSGPFMVNVFGRGLVARSLAGPGLAVLAVWALGMIRPGWLWNRRAAAAALALAAAHVAYWQITLPDPPGPAADKPVRAPDSFPGYKDYNLIVISLDTLRADHLGAYGYERPTSPAIDRLARESAVFEQAFSAAPATLSSHATAFTGLYPGAHRAQVMTHAGLPDAALTLPEILQARGYATGGFTGGAQLSRNFGFAQGFDAYEDRSQNIAGIWPPARAWLDSVRDRRFFLFLHCYDIHTPYAPPPPFNRMFDPDYRGALPDAITLELIKQINGRAESPAPEDVRHIIAQYDAGIRYTDTYIARVYDYLETSKLLDRTIVVLMSDHGEELGERGVVGFHAHSLHAEVLHVPLLVRLPRGASPRRVQSRVGLVDLTPTLLDLLAPPVRTDQFQGRSFAGLLAGGKPLRPRTLFAEKEHGHLEATGRTVAVYSGPLKLITRTPAPFEDAVMRWFGSLTYPAGGRNLYNVEKDAREQHDLLSMKPQQIRALDALARQTTAWNRRRTPDPDAGPAAVSPAERKRLKDLGYIK